MSLAPIFSASCSVREGQYRFALAENRRDIRPPRTSAVRKFVASKVSPNGVTDVLVLASPSTAIDVVRFDGSKSPATVASRLDAIPSHKRASRTATLPFPPRDASWCPFKSDDCSEDLFVCCSKAQPVTMFDPSDGTLRAAYSATDAMGNLVSPFAVLWRESGTGASEIYGGYNEHGDDKTLRIFDVLREGASPTFTFTSEIAPRGCVVSGLLAMQVTAPTYVSNLTALSYSGIPHLVELIDRRHRTAAGALRCSASADGGNGVSSLKASASDGNVLYSRARGNGCEVMEWDLRNMSSPRRLLLKELLREPQQNVADFDVTAAKVSFLVTCNDALISHQHASAASLVECSLDGSLSDNKSRLLDGCAFATKLWCDDAAGMTLVGCGRSDFSIRDQYELNEGLGHERSDGGKRSREPMSGDSGDDEDHGKQLGAGVIAYSTK